MHRPSPAHSVALAACIFASSAFFYGCRAGGKSETAAQPGGRVPPRALVQPTRAMWVARFHYRYPDDIRTIIRNSAALGCDTIYWQVRGAGTVLYPSDIEPWAREFDHRHPGFDPLAVAVRAAHEAGLRIEAWVNVLPGWRGPEPPPLRAQLWNARPEWFLLDARGRRQPLGDFYVILNPCHPDARRHIVSVVDEIVTKYDVDGVHLDYVRYAWDTEPDAAAKYPRDPVTLGRFKRATGLAPDEAPDAWRDWRANQLTQLVAEIRRAVDSRRPGASLTAAVVAHPESAYARFFQNGVAWVRSGLVDRIVPMAYSAELAPFRENISAYQELTGARRVVPGIGLYKHETTAALEAQFALCGRWGGDFALFSYDSLFPTHQDRALRDRAKQSRGAKARAAQRELSEKERDRALRRAVVERYAKNGAPP